jgi:nucleotide-binding universal stress UspA family protein
MNILIAYDGSANADHAIAVAGTLFPGAHAEILHVWEPGAGVAATAAAFPPTYSGGGDALDYEREEAGAVALRGVELARQAGLEATGETVGTAGPLWRGIVDRMAVVNPDMTIVGTRGLTGLRGALAGSVSHSVVSHAQQPVLTVPLPGDAPVAD